MFFSNRKYIKIQLWNISKIYWKTLGKHAYLKKTIRKKEKEKITHWVRGAVRHSMKIRNKSYRQFIYWKNDKTCKVKQSAFKKERNKIADLLQISRQSHYQKYFIDYKKNSKVLWKRVNEIIYSKKASKANNKQPIIFNNKPEICNKSTRHG